MTYQQLEGEKEEPIKIDRRDFFKLAGIEPWSENNIRKLKEWIQSGIEP